MADYRVYCINGTRVSASNLIEGETDDAARVKASALLGSCGHFAAEVWNRDRFVCRINRSDEAETGSAGLALDGEGNQ